MRTFLLLLSALILARVALPRTAAAADLEDQLGRTQLRIQSAPYALVPGRTVEDQGLAARLARLGYREVDAEPRTPGTWQRRRGQWWVHRPAFAWGGRSHGPSLFVVELGRGDTVERLRTPGGTVLGAGDPDTWLEPEVLATSWDGGRAPRIDTALEDLPEAAWRPLLALEDHRFFQHAGVSGRAIARAALANVQAGGVAEGGSTITQQLVKNRDLTPRRSLDRKASEAVRALALEASWSKEAILEAYLDTVYYGHINGVGVYGIGRAARAWFGIDAEDLELHQGALLAALVQAPNALHPVRHPRKARARRDHALDRMAELGWADADAVTAAKARPLDLDVHPPPREATRHVLDRVRTVVEDDAHRRLDKGLGFAIDTTLDPWLQARALARTEDWLERLRRGHGRLRGAPLHAVVVVMEAESGDILAYVGGDPGAPSDSFDRARRARRQPGSTVKPLLLLEAYDDCGSADPIRPSTLVDDGPLDGRLGDWDPRNADGRDLGAVSAHEALVASRNRPFAHLGAHCGLDAMADRLVRAGLPDPPRDAPAFLLGSVEASPLEVLQAHSLFANAGRTAAPRLVERIGRANGTRTGGEGHQRRRVAPDGPTWLVADALQDVVARGTGRAARLEDATARGKTGTSSDSRDAWFVGHADGLVTVVWVGLDEGRLGLGGGRAAAPLWRAVMQDAVATRPPAPLERPGGVVRCDVDPATGLASGVFGDEAAEPRWCLRRARPPRDQPWRTDSADRVP